MAGWEWIRAMVAYPRCNGHQQCPAPEPRGRFAPWARMGVGDVRGGARSSR